MRDGVKLRSKSVVLAKCAGQAMVETLIITVFLIMLSFATFQLILLAITHMSCNEANFSAARIVMVSSRDSESSAKIGLIYALYGQWPAGHIIPNLANWPSTHGVTIEGNGQNNIVIRDVTFKYFVKLIFSSFFGVIPSITGFIDGTSNVRTVISPDSDYYDKAYPRGGRFSEGYSI